MLAPLRGKVAPWWIPDAVIRVPRMPLSPTGKIDKAGTEGFDVTRTTERTPPRTSAKQPSRRPTKVQQRADKMEQILDAAEALFSKHGLHGVTLKDVARRVGAHHTLLNYYFADKKKLFDAVFARRAEVSSTAAHGRAGPLRRGDQGKPTVEGALRAFLDTDLDLYIHGGEGWKNYGALGAQVANTPEWGAELMDRQFDPVVLRLIDLLKKALPGLPQRKTSSGAITS